MQIKLSAHDQKKISNVHLGYSDQKNITNFLLWIYAMNISASKHSNGIYLKKG